MAMLEQTVARPQSAALMVIACETLQDTAGVLKESQREMLLLTLVEKLRAAIPPQMVLAQVSGYDFAILAHGLAEPWQAVTLSKQVLTVINERLPLQGSSCAPAPASGSPCSTAAQRRTALPARVFGRRHRDVKAKTRLSSSIRADGKGSAPPDGRARHSDRAR
jgi:GGDEF domain-containing protein